MPNRNTSKPAPVLAGLVLGMRIAYNSLLRQNP